MIARIAGLKLGWVEDLAVIGPYLRATRRGRAALRVKQRRGVLAAIPIVGCNICTLCVVVDGSLMAWLRCCCVALLCLGVGHEGVASGNGLRCAVLACVQANAMLYEGLEV